jgi:hypothetical protein
MASVVSRTLSRVRGWYNGLGPRRFRLLPVVVGESSIVVVAVLAALVLGVVWASHPERVSTGVTVCDLGARGAAQVTFVVNNADRIEHNYAVHLVVSGKASQQLGSGTVLVNHIAGGGSQTSQLLVPVTGDTAGATCTMRAEVFTGNMGHHG